MGDCTSAGGHAKCIGGLKRVAIANASWHLSSMSGGVEGVIRKMTDNAANALYDRNRTLFLQSTVKARALSCLHGENSNSKGAANYERTAWTTQRTPRYPHVPLSMERAFRDGNLLYLLGWSDQRVGLVWDEQGSAPIEVANVKPSQFRDTSGSCNMTGCYARKLGFNG